MKLEDLDSELENDESGPPLEQSRTKTGLKAYPGRPKADNYTSAQRVAEIYELVRRWKNPNKIEKWACERYGIGPRMARKLIHRARKLFLSAAIPNQAERLKENWQVTEAMLELAFEQKNPTAMKDAIVLRQRLTGDDPPTRIEQTGRDGGPIQVQNATLVIHAEADLGRFTEAERAEFQRLAESRTRALAPGPGEGEAPR